MNLFVWDLHGVLEQGNERVVVDISNAALQRAGFKQHFTYVDGCRLYGLKWYEYFQWLLPNEDSVVHLRLQEECVRIATTRPDMYRKWMRPTPNAHDVLAKIDDSQHDQILISNTRSHSLNMFMRMLKLGGYFSQEVTQETAFPVDQRVNVLWRTKKDVLSTYLYARAQEQELYRKIIIIGDSPNDMKLVDVAGGITYLYAHPGFPFRSCASDYKINDLKHVLKYAD